MNHVAMVIPGIDRLGGAESQVLQLARGLHQRGWQVTVIALSGTGGDAGQELIAVGVDFLPLGMRNGLADPSGWFRLHQWIRSQSPDILHAHLPHAAWMARWSRLFAPVRVALDTVHTSACGTLGRRVGYYGSDWLADAVTAVSQGAAYAYLTARMASAHRLLVIPNGVDTSCLKADPVRRKAIREELRLKDEFLWVTAGRMERVKNYPALLDAFAQLPQEAHLVMAGAGPMEAALRDQGANLGLTHRVRFPGFDPNLLRWMQAADGFVLPSLWEGLPMVLLEAGACGLPLVATDVPGSRDVVVPGETGLLSAPGNTTALAETMRTMMCLDPAARATLGRNARQRTVELFSLETVLNRWDNLYHQLLSERPTPSHVGRLRKAAASSALALSADAAPPATEPTVRGDLQIGSASPVDRA